MKKWVLFSLLTLFLSPLALGKVDSKAHSKIDCSDTEQFAKNPVTLDEMVQIAKNDSATIIDVNTRKSYDEIKIGKAVHFKTEKKKLSARLPADKGAPIVAYCGGPQCSAWERAAKAACKAGYTNIRHFPGGITEWKRRKQKS